MAEIVNSPTSSCNETQPDGATPELTAYYSNRPLMWRNLSMILLLNVGWAMSFTVVSPLIQLRLNRMGVSPSGWGIMTALNCWIYSYAVMYFAWKSDHTVSRFGRRIPYLFISAPVIIVSVFLFPFVHITWLLVVLALLQMFFTDIKAATIPLLNIDCMPRRLLARTAAPAAIVMGITSFLSMRYGMKLADWIEAVPYLLAGGLLFFTTLVGGVTIKEPPVKTPTTEKFRPWSAMRVAWKDRRAVILMISVSLFQTFSVCYGAWIWLYAKNSMHLTQAQTGIAMSWSILIGVCLAFPISWLVDRVSPYKLLPIFCLVAGAALLFLLNVTSVTQLIIVAALITIMQALYPASDIMVYRNANPAEIGSVTSTNSCLRGFYNGCMGVTYGFVIEKTGGHYEYAFILAYGLTVLGLVPLFYYRHLMMRDLDSDPKRQAPDCSSENKQDTCEV